MKNIKIILILILLSFTCYSQVAYNGQFTVGDSIWDDLRVSASATKVSPVTDKPDTETIRDGLTTLAFDAGSVEAVTFTVQLPHTWKTGTDVHPHIHWSPGNSTNTGTVVWGFEYTIISELGNFPEADTLFVSDAGDGVAYKHQIAVFTAIDMSGIGGTSPMFICRLLRDGDESESGLTDSFNNDAFFLEFDFHFQKDGAGSDAIRTKSW